jgi:guanine nucleotide-binding protein G(i) subunit alpha
MEHIDRVSSEEYVPTYADILKARVKTTAVTEWNISLGSREWQVIEVGGLRPERKKWIHAFEQNANIIYVSNLDDYHDVLFEDETTNRLQESLKLFESLVNSRWFVQSKIIMLFTNIDLFVKTLAKKPLKDYYPDYLGGEDATEASKYLLRRFHQRNHARLDLYPFVVEATDTARMRIFFDAVNLIFGENRVNDNSSKTEVELRRLYTIEELMSNAAQFWPGDQYWIGV